MTATSHSIPTTRLEIVILGGGFAGVYCGKKIGYKLGKSSKARTALISNQNYMVFQPMLAEVAGGSLSPRHVVNPIRMLCRGIEVFKGDVDWVNLETRQLHINTGSFSAGVNIQFNHLVLALGAEIDLSRVPGMPEHALLMQNVGDAMILRATIISRIEEANLETRPEVRRRLLTFVVVGGGYSGVETAGEVLDMLHGIAKYYHGINREELRVVLIHSRDRILNTLSHELAHYAEGKLQKRGLEIVLKDRVKAVTATRVYLTSGEVIETTTVVSTVGNAPNQVIRNLCDQHDIEHDRYRIITDESMRVPGFDFLWAAGDCAAVPLHESEDPNEYCPQTAQFAMRQGALLAQNLVNTIRGKELAPFTFKGLGELASIGHQTAVANVFGMKFEGFLAWFLWRTVYLSKLPGLDRKLRVIIDWTLDLFFPRDINLLNPRYTSLFQEVHLEPGDLLFNRGEPAFSLYVVKKGTVQLKDADGSVVRTIEPGDFFGERALVHGGGYLYDAQAPDSTQLLSVSGDVILPFLQTSRRLNRVLAKTTAQVSAEAELQSVEEKMDPTILSLPVSEVMCSDVATLRPDHTVAEAIQFFRKRRFSIYPLCTREGKLIGVIGREDFFDYIKRSDVDQDCLLERVNRMHLPSCQSHVTVDEALEHMIRSGRHKCLVTDDEGHLQGIITVMDLIGATTVDEPASGDTANPV